MAKQYLCSCSILAALTVPAFSVIAGPLIIADKVTTSCAQGPPGPASGSVVVTLNSLTASTYMTPNTAIRKHKLITWTNGRRGIDLADGLRRIDRGPTSGS